jgi:hypothetical protein
VHLLERKLHTKFCITRVNILLVTCAQLSLILSFSSGRVRGALLNTVLQVSAAIDPRIRLQSLSSFLGTQLSETGRHGSSTGSCLDRFEVCAMLSKAISHFLRLTVAQTSMLEMKPHSHERSQQRRACDHVACSRLFSYLSHSQLRETAPPSSPYSLLVIPCTCAGF